MCFKLYTEVPNNSSCEPKHLAPCDMTLQYQYLLILVSLTTLTLSIVSLYVFIVAHVNYDLRFSND
jgi:hypothetical protein